MLRCRGRKSEGQARIRRIRIWPPGKLPRRRKGVLVRSCILLLGSVLGVFWESVHPQRPSLDAPVRPWATAKERVGNASEQWPAGKE